MRKGLAAALLLAAAVASCDRDRDREPSPSPSSPAASFGHELSGDVSGDYRPLSDEGDLVGVYLGQEATFVGWETGQGGSAPVVLTLRTPDGPLRVGPARYRVTDDAVRFSGVSPLGPVTLDARLDPGALATARRNLGDRTVVLRGVLTVGGRRSDVRLGWWGGD